MQAFLSDWVAGPSSDLPLSLPLEKLRNLLGSLPGAGSSAAASSLLPVPLWEGSFAPRLHTEDEVRPIWTCIDHRGVVRCWAVERKHWQWWKSQWGRPLFSNESGPRLGYFNQSKPQTLEEIRIRFNFQVFKLAVFPVFKESSLLCQSLCSVAIWCSSAFQAENSFN